MRSERGIGEPTWARAALVLVAVAAFAVMLVLPLATVFAEALSSGLPAALGAIAQPDALAAMRLTVLVAAIVVPLNTAFGIAASWCLARFRFPGRALLSALTELPFAVSPVIAGLIYVLLFGRQGWLGPWLGAHGIKIVFALPGIVLASLFVTLPFVARQLVPAMQAQGADEEEAALTLGASGWQMFRRVTLPKMRLALLSGVLLCNARAMGEFGAVSVVSGHIRGLTNTMPLHVEILYNEYDIAGAFAMSALLACLGLATLALREALAWRARRAEKAGAAAVLAAA